MLPAFGLALVASLALSGLAAGSASATQFVYCTNVGTGFKALYEDSECSKTGGTKSYGWKQVFTSTPFTMNGTSDFKIKVPNYLKAFPELVITCSSQSIEEGVLGSSSLTARIKLSGPSNVPCKTNVKNCSANVAGFNVKGEATYFGGPPAVKFTPGAGESLAEITFNPGCGGLLEGSSPPFTGSFTGYMISPGSSLEFTAAGSALQFGGYAAILEGTTKIKTAAGEALKVAL